MKNPEEISTRILNICPLAGKMFPLYFEKLKKNSFINNRPTVVLIILQLQLDKFRDNKASFTSSLRTGCLVCSAINSQNDLSYVQLPWQLRRETSAL